jgi:hypothetical protein
MEGDPACALEVHLPRLREDRPSARALPCDAQRIRRPQSLGDESLLWDLSDQLEPEVGMLWIYDLDGVEILAFTDDGIEALREIIRDQIDKAG